MTDVTACDKAVPRTTLTKRFSSFFNFFRRFFSFFLASSSASSAPSGGAEFGATAAGEVGADAALGCKVSALAFAASVSTVSTRGPRARLPLCAHTLVC